MTKKEWRIFTDVPDELVETWTDVALFGGMVDLAHNDYSLALNFKQSGDVLIKYGLQDMEAYELLYPALFNCRHAIELYLKALVQPTRRSHDLGYLLEGLEKLLMDHHNTEIPMWFRNLISEFEQYDPRATTFRYPGLTTAPEERVVDLSQLQRHMHILFQAFHRIYLAEIDYRKKSS
ncbi:MAG: HEPN domain-containing protein [Anaerolineae bacterium]|nr:HEPN domain-containing protein [Anaerolineae bacterium]